MSDADLRASAMRLREITPSQIDEVIDSIVVDPDDRALLKERLKARRQDLMDRFNIPEGADDPELYPDPIPLTEAMGYQAQDLQPGDITAGDSFDQPFLPFRRRSVHPLVSWMLKAGFIGSRKIPDLITDSK